MISVTPYQFLAHKVTPCPPCPFSNATLIRYSASRAQFANPFAKVLRLWGVGDLSKLVYAAKKIYDVHREDLERERTDDEFMAMYEQYEAFDELEDEFLEKEEEYTALVASYVDEHLESFAKIIK